MPHQFKSRCLHLLQRLCLIHRPVPDGMIRWIHVWAAGRTEWEKQWWSHLKPHLHLTCSLFLGTQIKKQRIPYIINLETIQGYKLLKRAKHGIKAKASVGRVLFSTRYRCNQLWLGKKQRQTCLPCSQTIMASIFSYQSKMLEIKLKLSFLRLICNFVS